MSSLLSWFLSPLGLLVLAALDSSPIVFLPFANDFVVIYLTARSPGEFWLFPILATVGGVVGTAVSHLAGVLIGEEGLERWVPAKRLESVKRRVGTTGAFMLGLTALAPPPFPFTAFALASGTLAVNRPIFFMTVAAARLARFLGEALLARHYGKALVGWMESAWFRDVIWGFAVLAIAGTAYSIYRIARKPRQRRSQTSGG